MKLLVAACLAFAALGPADATSIVIDGSHGKMVLVPEPDYDIFFTMQLLSGPLATFTFSAWGDLYADPRYCSGFPPGEEPADCDAPLDSFANSGAFTATSPDPTWADLPLPFMFGGVNGHLYFGPTDGGRVLITVDGTAAPEPASWAMMLGGVAAVGAALRARRNMAATFA